MRAKRDLFAATGLAQTGRPGREKEERFLIYLNSWKRRFFNRDVILLIKIEPAGCDYRNKQCTDYEIPHDGTLPLIQPSF
jgi:hypothetical protein